MEVISIAPITAPRPNVKFLTDERSSRVAFADLAFELRAGEILWVRGRNGLDKTGLLRLVAGLGAGPRGGSADAGGAGSAPRRVVYVGHANAIKEELSVADALTFLLRIHGGRLDPAALTAALDHWGLLAQRDRAVRGLSAGQLRRLALARLACERRAALWVLDEAFEGLDAEGAACLNDLMRTHVRRGGTILFTGDQRGLSADLPCLELALDEADTG